MNPDTIPWRTQETGPPEYENYGGGKTFAHFLSAHKEKTPGLRDAMVWLCDAENAMAKGAAEAERLREAERAQAERAQVDTSYTYTYACTRTPPCP